MSSTLKHQVGQAENSFMARPRIVLLQTAIGDYRQEVLTILAESPQVDFQVYSGPIYFDGTTRTGVDLGNHLHLIQNHFLLSRKLLWQTGHWKAVLDANAAIIEFNPRIISNWALLAARKLLRRRSVLWGHAWPRSGRESKSTGLRKLMAQLADGVVVYTETQAAELRQYLPGTKIVAAPNSLYRRDQMGAALAPSGATDFIYVGRLVAAKKPELLVRAFLSALDRLPASTRLVVVGDGPMKTALEAMAASASGRIVFTGHVSDLAKLRDFYARSIASVSPGYVGLSITQSFAFGVPMVVSRNEPHAPEIEAMREGENSVFFETDSEIDLARVMLNLSSNSAIWLQQRTAIAGDCRERYSAEKMSSRLLESIGIVDVIEDSRDEQNDAA